MNPGPSLFRSGISAATAAVCLPTLCLADEEAGTPGLMDRFDPFYVRDVGWILNSGRHSDFALENLENPTLQINGGGPVIALNLQGDLTQNPQDAPPALFTFTNDFEADSSFAVIDAALIAKFYFPGIGGDGVGSGSVGLFGYDPSKLGFHLAFSADIDYQDGGDSERDSRTYSVQARWRRLPAIIDGLGGDFPDLVGLSYDYEENRITGTERSSVSLIWDPSINLDWLYSNLRLGERNYMRGMDVVAPKEGGASAKMEGGTEQTPGVPSDTFFYVRPTFGLEAADSSFADSGALEEDDYYLKWGLSAGFGLFGEHLTINYRLSGIQPLEDLDGGRYFHEASVEFNPLPNNPLSIYASYRNGEEPPDFIQQESLVIGLSIKF